jgi:hypothetical protein
MLRLGAAGLIGLGLWPRRLSAKSATSGDFTFIAVNDLHFVDADCRPWFDKVVAEMKRKAPEAEFCLLGGDQADGGSPEQLLGAREAFAGLGIPVHAVIGNHDYRWDNDRSDYERIFPGQINYHFEHRGWQVIALDTTEGTKAQWTVIPQATFDWLGALLPKLDARKPTIVVTHFPLGQLVFGRPLNAPSLLEGLGRLNLQAVFSGHFHGFTERHFEKAVLTTDKCCSRVRSNHDGTKEKGWFLCRAAQGTVTREFVEFRA